MIGRKPKSRFVRQVVFPMTGVVTVTVLVRIHLPWCLYSCRQVEAAFSSDVLKWARFGPAAGVLGGGFAMVSAFSNWECHTVYLIQRLRQ